MTKTDGKVGCYTDRQVSEAMARMFASEVKEVVVNTESYDEFMTRVG